MREDFLSHLSVGSLLIKLHFIDRSSYYLVNVSGKCLEITFMILRYINKIKIED